MGKREIKVSLNRKKPARGKTLLPRGGCAGRPYMLQRAEGGALRLTHKQILGLAAQWYKRQLAAREDEPGSLAELEIMADVLINKYYAIIHRMPVR
jgi:hypothetical protein